MPRARSPSIAILGCGAVGGVFAWGLARGWKRARCRGELWLWSRSAASVASLRKELASLGVRVRVLAQPEDALSARTAVLVCVPDGAIAPLAQRLARSIPARRRALPAFLHSNGYLGAEVLRALARKGAAVGKLHPFMAANRNSSHMEGMSFGIEGDARALRAARSILRWIGGQPMLLSKGAGPRYHASASLLSGGIVALYELADRLLVRSVPSQAARRRALDELASSTLNNIWFNGTRAALTGAIARGAEEIVRGHVRTLRRMPDALATYCVLGLTMLELARARRSLDAARARRLRVLLEQGPRRSPRPRR